MILFFFSRSYHWLVQGEIRKDATNSRGLWNVPEHRGNLGTDKIYAQSDRTRQSKEETRQPHISEIKKVKGQNDGSRIPNTHDTEI